ncbi:MAG: ribosome biogenesis GTPase Der [Candidatus Calescibacterium sp.]|nr:ribosome biogenesis GTPase Der [Candidatus Calescibacterium sp.]MCX7971928.1 ribosome biogenesis GTPase Der [bacterium]MDW8194973.1 ribosome biogenesis GTPase Der [Candidatus Calescibacterium sp.]
MSIVVSIVGRPNVGKSTLFNLLVNKGIAVVSEVEGTTRDILIKACNFNGEEIIFIDTGGIIRSDSDIDSKVRQKVEEVILNSDVILFVVDNQQGIGYTDIELSELIRKNGLKNRTILVLNKSESRYTKEEEFESLGIKNSIQISCKTRMNLKELLFMILDLVSTQGYVQSKFRNFREEGRKVGFVGRPNVGKSSLINSILQDDRVIISDIPGTTRDSIDIPFVFGNHKFVLIDTPGVRRKPNISSKLEAYSITRSLGTIKYADIVVLVIDIYEGLTRQDKRIAYQIYKHEKPCIIVANKFDLVINQYKNNKNFSNQVIENLKYELSDWIKRQLYLLPYAPVVFVSAKENYQVDSVIYSLIAINEQLDKDLSSFDLRELFDSMVLSLPPMEKEGRKIRLKVKNVKYYKEEIPTIKVYSNFADIPENYKDYLRNTVSKVLNIPNVPIRLLFTDKRVSK